MKERWTLFSRVQVRMSKAAGDPTELLLFTVLCRYCGNAISDEIVRCRVDRLAAHVDCRVPYNRIEYDVYRTHHSMYRWR